MRNSLGTLRTTLLIAVSVFIAGCLSGGGDSSNAQAGPGPGPAPGPSNNPPTVTGTPPASVVVGENYAFTPTASDPDGDTLTFTIENQPGWANFDSTSGALTGVVPAGSEGTYPNIRITASDGTVTTSLTAFAIEVLQSANGTATLTWTPPTQNTDGSALTDLDSYRIYYGTSPGNYPNQVVVDNPGLSSYVLQNLAPNTYYFVSTSINASGIESAYSNMATMTVN